MEWPPLFWPERQADATNLGGPAMKTASVKPVRCAIYTRVSTDQGLDQEFNSLDAQYDASSAYIRSQVRIPMKSPLRTEMISPPDSDMMSPPEPVPLAMGLLALSRLSSIAPFSINEYRSSSAIFNWPAATAAMVGSSAPWPASRLLILDDSG